MNRGSRQKFLILITEKHRGFRQNNLHLSWIEPLSYGAFSQIKDKDCSCPIL